MKKFFLTGSAIATAVLFASVAHAADMPAPATYNWTGFYVGATAGAGWSNDGGVRYDGNNLTSRQDDIDSGALVSVLGDDPSGFIGGLEAGYNWQSNALLLGIETDFSFANIDGDGSTVSPSGFNDLSASQSIDWFGSTRLRIGYAADRFLVYATGGVAYGDTQFDYKISNPNGVLKADSSEWSVGWTAGGGVEYAFDDSWTAKVEYLYYDLGNSDVKQKAPPPFQDQVFKFSSDFQGSIVRAGVNYRF